MFDFLDANKSGELYTAEAVESPRKPLKAPESPRKPLKAPEEAVEGPEKLADNRKLKISELEKDVEKKRKIV